jgi:flagellum-specific peptidoglycan hydrolase FlgJ
MQKEKIIFFIQNKTLYLSSKLKVMLSNKVTNLFLIFLAGVSIGVFATKLPNNYLLNKMKNTTNYLEVAIDEEQASSIYLAHTYSQDLNLILQSANSIDRVHAFYIRRYAETAIREQELYGFPASVKLAQLLIEGGYNTKNPKGSKLVIEGNNPFGIKYHGNNIPNRIGNWEDLAFPNEFIYAKDDCISECKFIKFRGIWHAFRFHSKFMVGSEENRSHYYSFISDGDWRDWLNALERGGYATSKDYKNILESIIIRYKLYLLDVYKPEHV